MSLILEHIDVTVPDGPYTNTILSDLSLRVDPGQVLAVTGVSGSGKSTLLAVAGLLRRPDGGTVSVAGTCATDLRRGAVTRLRGKEIGLIFQASNLFPSLTALEQVQLVAHIDGHLDHAARERARELLVDVGLEHRLDQRPAQLSGGERQRVGIARALMNEPSVVLADEPTASLDDDRGREIMTLLVEQASARGAAMVIATHNPAQIPTTTSQLHLQPGIPATQVDSPTE